MRLRAAGLAIALAAACVPGSAFAQYVAADTAAVYFTRGPSYLSRLGLTPWADLRLRADAVHDRPGAPDFDRQRATLRAGLVWERPSQAFRIEAGFRASLGSDHNHETWSSFDNETADTLEVDRLGFRATTMKGDALAAGKMRLPVPLTEMVWDDDLRPVGIAIVTRLGWTGVEGVSLGGGMFTRAQFDADDVQFGVAQIGFERGNPATTSGAVRASYFGVGHTNAIVSQGLARQNRVVPSPPPPHLAEDFHLVDLQLTAETHAGRWPLTARVDGAMNAAAENDNQAIRVRLAAGGASAPWGMEAGWVYQRIEREAVAGAFNSDDWWFHGRSKGHSFFVNAGIARALSARVATFFENRDDVSQWTERLIAELRWRWGD